MSLASEAKVPSQSIDVVTAAKNLVPLILAGREEGERIRHVPPEIANALAEAGLLQMFLPRSMGGSELPPLTVFEAIETLSRADGSIGWCAMLATIVSMFTGWLSERRGAPLLWSSRRFPRCWVITSVGLRLSGR